jgi:hypothetical protein
MNITDLNDKTIREQGVRMKISGKYLTTRLLMKRQKYLPYQRGLFFMAGLQSHVKRMKKKTSVSALLYKSNLTFPTFLGFKLFR